MTNTILATCSKCHAPLEKQQTFPNGSIHTIACACLCDRQKELAYKQKEAQREEQQRIRQLKSVGLQHTTFKRWNFSQDNGNTPQLSYAHNYVAHFSEMKANATGLLLWGDVGTGKTFFAACVANALLEKGVPVLMTNFHILLNQMGGLYAEEKNNYATKLLHYQLLIIDDLGVERNTEYTLEQIYAIVEARYRSGLPMLITTNLTISQLNNPPSIAHSRIYSRLLEMCQPICFSGINQREMQRDYHRKGTTDLLLEKECKGTLPHTLETKV